MNEAYLDIAGLQHLIAKLGLMTIPISTEEYEQLSDEEKQRDNVIYLIYDADDPDDGLGDGGSGCECQIERITNERIDALFT